MSYDQVLQGLQRVGESILGVKYGSRILETLIQRGGILSQTW